MENSVNYKLKCPQCGNEIRISSDDIYSIGTWGDGSDIEVVNCPKCNDQVVLSGVPYERIDEEIPSA